MSDVQYVATLDDKQILAELKRLNASFDKLADQADKSFQRAAKEAKVSGVQIGLVSGVVQELTRRFLNLAQQGAQTFLRIAEGGVDLNRQLELTRISLTNIFEGNEQAADAFIGQVDKLAVRLRVDFQELRTLGRGILPDIGDAQQTLKIMEQFVILGRDAGQNWTSVRIALEEAATGQFTSLQRRLNIPAESIRRIKALSEEVGIADALIQVLGDRIQKAGLNLDDFADTFEAQAGAIQAGGRELQAAFGAPIFEELKEQAGDFLDTFDEHKDDLLLVADAFGDLVAHAIKLVGTNLADVLNDIDYASLAGLADDLRMLADAVSLLNGAFGKGSLIGDFFRDLDRGIKDSAIQIRDFSAWIARRQAESASLTERGKALNLGLFSIGTPDQAALEAGERAYQKVVDDFAASQAEAAAATEERTQATRESTQADTTAGDAILKHKKQLEDLAEAEAAAADAQKKIEEETTKAIEDAQRRRLEITIGTERKRLDNEIKNAQEVEDVWRKHYDALADAATDLSRTEEDARRQAARDETELERDAAGERLSIETEYRRELQRIRDRFNMAASEAERNNDAQAFLAAMRQRDADVLSAQRTRQESVEDAKTRAQEQRAALQEQLAYELEDAQIANRRKLEDLQTTLQRELEEQAIKAIRAEEARRTEYARELADFARKEAERVASLQKSLADEVALVRRAEQLKREIRVAEAQATIAQVQAVMQQLGLREIPYTGSTRNPSVGRRMGRGGDVDAGEPIIVGDRGPEILIPRVPSYVVPNAAIGGAVSNVSTVFNQQRAVNLGAVNVSESLFSDPIAMRRLHNVVLGILTEAL